MSIMARHAALKSRTYVDGNTVRKAVPARALPKRVSRSREARLAAYRRQQQEREKLYEEQQKRLRRKSMGIDALSLMALLLASGVTLGLCFSYIQLQTEINTHISSIEKKSSELEKLKSENDALQSSIDTSVDLDEVYRVATQELGMVYADQDQVITYSKTESGYVRQYEDIPKN